MSNGGSAPEAIIHEIYRYTKNMTRYITMDIEKVSTLWKKSNKMKINMKYQDWSKQNWNSGRTGVDSGDCGSSAGLRRLPDGNFWFWTDPSVF